MINESKPNIGISQTELNIGSGFNLLVGGLFRLIVGAAGSAGMTNTDKASTAITNVASPFFDPLWVASVSPWLLALPWQINNSGITNSNKPV